MEDTTIGNQQVRLDELAWLAGVIDGEGTINITKKLGSKKRARKDGTRKMNYWVFLQVTNTNEQLILKVIEIMKKLNANPYVWEKKDTDKWKKAYQLSLQRMVKVKRVVEKINPYLIAKKRQAELVLKFIDSRLSKFQKGKGKTNPYTEEEMKWINEIKRLNHRGNLRDYMPDTLTK